MSNYVIAIDGPAASGKSSVAKGVAQRLNIPYINTGNMYRALTAEVLKQNVDLLPENESLICQILENMHLQYQKDDTATYQLFAHQHPCGDEIRTPEVTAKVSVLAAMPSVREALVEQQRKIATETALVMEGRDIGTVVFPNAKYKFFLTATPRVRAERRLAQSGETEQGATVESVAEEIATRDLMDSQRAVSPLKKADDAHLIDSSSLTLEQTIQAMQNLMQ